MAVNRTTLTLIAALALVGNASAQTGNLLVNGSFEEGSFTGDARTSYNHVGPYGTVVTGWVGLANGFDWHQPVEFGPTYDGYKMVDLTFYAEAGAIAQTFSTVPGTAYVLRFAVMAPADSDASAAGLRVDVASTSESYIVPRTSTWASSRWTPETLHFTATDASTTLTFSGLYSNYYWGPVIDAVSVTAVPEPQAATLLLVGLGLVALKTRRRVA